MLIVTYSLLFICAVVEGFDLHPGETSYWCTGCEGPELADTLLTFQRSSGGWPKNQDPQAGDVYSGTETRGCLDNGATVDEIRFLVQAYKETGELVYRKSGLDGLDFVFKSQHPTGGWPQYYPLIGGYYDAITFNDDVHINVMNLLDEVAAQTSPFDISPFSDESARAQSAKEKGMQCILDTQIQIPNGLFGGVCPSRTNWCAQHDRFTLKPVAARDYEPASFSGYEGMNIARYLMNVDNPRQEIKDAIVGAYVWAKQSVLLDYEQQRDGGNGNKELVYSEGAMLWPRFATIPDSTVIFCDRGCVKDNTLMYNDFPVGLSQMSGERRNGYSWLGSWGLGVIEMFENEWSVNHPDVLAGLDECLSSTSAPTVATTPSPSIACAYDQCIGTCSSRYGGDGTSGNSYMCSKGCAGMSGGQIKKPLKFCTVDESERYNFCLNECSNASSSSSNQAICREGCKFWQVSNLSDALSEAPTSVPTKAPVAVITLSPVTDVCDSEECIESCIQMYGGDGTAGGSYMCSKGCAEMGGGQIKNPNKFCDVAEADRYGVCLNNCSRASSHRSNQEKCREGCKFWQILVPGPVQTTACNSGKCIERCIARFGGDGSRDSSYYCSKGCSGMGKGKITNAGKYCDVEEAERYEYCLNSCASASGNSGRRNDCKYGCEFWIQ